VNWNLIWAPQDFLDTLRAAGRTQVDVYGNPVDWLCPSDPANLQIELDTMIEVVQNYDVDGIHFDYIRYPHNECCYCEPCRTRFEAQTGHIVTDWPMQCYNGSLASEYRDWRAEQITRLVEAVSREAHLIKPQLQVSAAVFPSYPDCRWSIGQDWVEWIDQGYLDFVCPMDYTEDFERFHRLVSAQSALVAGRIPLYPGIGATATASHLGSDAVIAQILTARNLGTPGFIIFNYNPSMAEQILPDLAKGITAPRSASVELFWAY